MNRIDRLFATLLQLQTQTRLRASDLAQRFGISKRTVYRDIAALSEMGVPVVSLPGEGYELMPGYYLPPLLFTPKEAQAIFLATQMLINQTEGTLIADAEGALAKIAHVLPAPTQEKASQLARIIDFFTETKGFNLDNRQLITLQKAIQERRLILLHYYGRNRETLSTRTVEPTALTYSEGRWYLRGYCRWRDDWRSFRLARMESIQLLDARFEVRHSAESQQPLIMARIQFSPSVIRWVSERQHYGFVKQEDDEFVYGVHRLEELVPWLLSWGADAVPLAPMALRARISAEIDALQKKLT